MLKEKFEEVKALISKKTEGNNKRKIENLVVFLIILIITIIIINIVWKDNKSSSEQQDTQYKELAELDADAGNVDTVQSGDSFEQRLEYILSNISGVRQCKSTYHLC